MIAGLKRYGRMKASADERLGEVPEHWDIRTLKQVCRFAYGDGLPSETRVNGSVPVFGSNGCVGFHWTANTESPCIVIGRKGSFGKIKYCGEAVYAIDTTFFVDRRRTRAYMRWLFFLLGWLRLDTVTRDSAVPGLERDEAYRHRTAVPPIREQKAIAQYLDNADRRIEHYIEAKQKLITLLEEQKQAVIRNAVTGKVDVRTGKRYMEYRDAGLEDVGAIPNHWRVVPLKRVLSRIVDCEHKTAPKVNESEYFVIRTTAVRNGTLLRSGTYCTDSDSFKEWTRRSVPRYGDVIFTREAPAGQACVVPRGQRVCLGQRTVLLRPEQGRYDPHFLVHMIYEGPPKSRIQLAAQGSTVGDFNVDDIGSMPVLMPTLDEQTRIVEYLKSVTGRIDAVCSRLDRGAQVLRELRTRLVADVVTGKLDAREAAKKLPEADVDDVERDWDCPHGGSKGVSTSWPP